MGKKRSRKIKFLTKHPKCCFCGGEKNAEEEDHFPSRAMFDNRQWPEGFCFPACSTCNRYSRKQESLVSFLSRIHSQNDNEFYQKTLQKCTLAIYENYPGLLESMKVPKSKAKNAVKKYRIYKPYNISYKDIPLISLESPVVDEAINTFSLKLMLALYYKHLNVILPVKGGIVVKWYTNLEVINGELPADIDKQLKGYSVTKRCNTNLGDQFFYKYGITDKKSAMFVCVFRLSFVIVGIVKLNANEFKKIEGMQIQKPLKL